MNKCIKGESCLHCDTDYCRFKNEVAELKAENERLKETEKEISDFISDISTCGFRYDDRCPDNLDELQQCIEDLCNKFDNYKQALQEVREELEEDITCESRECGCDDYGECLNCLKEIILAKINEVIGAEE